MTSTTADDPKRIALNLSLRDWLVVVLIVTVMIAVMPMIPFRPPTPVVDRDYRMPYALSSRYDIYRRFTALSAAQFPTILVGDSVVWGQFADRDQTLSHYLNELTHQPRYINAGLDAMHPIALHELLEYHAQAIQKKDIVLEMNPLWLMVARGSAAKEEIDPLANRPGLVPRLAVGPNGTYQEKIEAAVARALAGSPVDRCASRIADARLDFLAWSLDHPYESPHQAISAGLPPSEDSYTVRKIPWNGTEGAKLDYDWPVLEMNAQWQAFERILDLLQSRQNRVFVLVGPMNEHMMTDRMRAGYQELKQRIQEKITSRGLTCCVPTSLRSEHYSDICHPLAAGYEELARELLKSQSSWLLGHPSSR
jgi:hypothetical protein